jgi:RNA polymerase sigma-70 factor (ECF subfamily)
VPDAAQIGKLLVQEPAASGQRRTCRDVVVVAATDPDAEHERSGAHAVERGDRAGLALLDALADEPQLRRHHPYHAARARLLDRLGRNAEAARAYRRALDLAGTEPERAFLRRRLDTAESAARTDTRH